MVKHLENYFQQISGNSKLIESIKITVNATTENFINTFNYKEHLTGLLLGNVQSGKTAQMFGIIANSADLGFEIFVLITTDNVYLQQQTLERALTSLDTLNICGENDDLRFTAGKLRKPILLILKKNTNILKKWRNNISSSNFCDGRPIFIIDDEADAASLNTKVNKNEQSQINSQIESIKKLSSSSLYLQVTATPQAVILLSKSSGFRPSFVHYFPPGTHYIGGNFFYSEPASYATRLTEENELDDLRDPSIFIPEGLRQSLMAFLVSAAHIHLSKLPGNCCNFLIHPSVKINDHETIADKIGGYLNLLLHNLTEETTKEQLEVNLKEAWVDLQSTKPDLVDFKNILEFVYNILDDENINIFVMNSKQSQEINVSQGINIIVGGNSLGRGVTFPHLQTVYYCRKSKTPQADTFWQHCRMFGYDRDPGLMRVFLPPLLLKLFTNLNNANQALINQIVSLGIDEVSLLYPPNIKPTRSNVVEIDATDVIVGGVNYFPSQPKRKYFEKADRLLSKFSEKESFHEINLDFAINLLEFFESETTEDWNKIIFINCLKTLKSNKNKYSEKAALIVRRNRDISKGTGTLLSPDDRKIGSEINDKTVLTVYRINGNINKGWNGLPLWIPNIKLPKNINFYRYTFESE